jgi:hypothetical protein
MSEEADFMDKILNAAVSTVELSAGITALNYSTDAYREGGAEIVAQNPELAVLTAAGATATYFGASRAGKYIEDD